MIEQPWGLSGMSQRRWLLAEPEPCERSEPIFSPVLRRARRRTTLVAAAKRGEVSAFEELVTRYERKIFRVTRNITGNLQDAEDAMQEAFLKSYEHLETFKGDSRFYTWLVRIAVNEALMRLRRRHLGGILHR